MTYRARQIFLAVMCVLFITGSMTFHFCGKYIRDTLSPEVTWVYPEYIFSEDGSQVLLCLPANTVRFNEDGRGYVFEIHLSEDYSERCYEVSPHFVEIESESDGFIYLRLSEITGEVRVVVDPPIKLKDGTRVRI